MPVPDKRELRKADRLTRAEARRTPHEFGVPANPYKSALICAHCGLPQSSAIHSPQMDHKFSCNVSHYGPTATCNCGLGNA